MDPLKDAAGSSFGKADRLCLYLHDQKLCRVEEHQHQLAHQFTKHNWDMGMGYLWLNGWDIYHLMGGAFMAYWVGHL